MKLSVVALVSEQINASEDQDSLCLNFTNKCLVNSGVDNADTKTGVTKRAKINNEFT